MSKLPSVFLTYGWCRVSYVIVHSLARRGVTVHVGDASRLAMCRYSRQQTSFSRYRNPYRDPEGFVDDVVKAMARTRATVLIPGHEDVLAIAQLRDRFPSEVLIPISSAEAIARTINKWQIVSLARAARVPVPDTIKPETGEEMIERAAEFKYPAIVKTQLGNSGKGVFVVRDAQECRERFDWLVKTYDLDVANWPILQGFAAGTGYGVCLLYNRGEFRAAFCERYLRCKDGQFGTSVFRESVYVPELEAHARALMDTLKWHGVVHLDFQYDEATGQAALIEINPRFWGALDLAVRAGVDFPWLLYKMAVDGDVEPVSSYQTGIKSRWIMGEMLHVINLVRRGRVRKTAQTITKILGTRPNGYDDFRMNDPMPLLFEMLYYSSGFLRSGSTNPIEEGMIG
ncbi:MAG: ATP-grasp domain-containing protein [Pyrinomonadaceae bacterium]